MERNHSLSDQAALRDLGARAERARVARDLSQQEVAERAGVGKRTVERFEAGESTTTLNLVRMLRALDLLDRLVDVAPAPAPSPLVQLQRARRERQRASSRSRRAANRDTTDAPPAAGASNRPFRWGDEEAST